MGNTINLDWLNAVKYKPVDNRQVLVKLYDKESKEIYIMTGSHNKTENEWIIGHGKVLWIYTYNLTHLLVCVLEWAYIDEY